MVKNTYETIKEARESGHFMNLVNKGVVSYTPLAHLEIYECFKSHEDKGVTRAVLITSIEMNISESRVWDIKRFMES